MKRRSEKVTDSNKGTAGVAATRRSIPRRNGIGYARDFLNDKTRRRSYLPYTNFRSRSTAAVSSRISEHSPRGIFGSIAVTKIYPSSLHLPSLPLTLSLVRLRFSVLLAGVAGFAFVRILLADLDVWPWCVRRLAAPVG